MSFLNTVDLVLDHLISKDWPDVFTRAGKTALQGILAGVIVGLPTGRVDIGVVVGAVAAGLSVINNAILPNKVK